MASFFSSNGNANSNVTGINDIPAPASDDDKNRPPADAATRITDFVRVRWPECGGLKG